MDPYAEDAAEEDGDLHALGPEEYLRAHDVAATVEEAVAALVRARPARNIPRWLAWYFAGDPDVDGVLARLDRLESAGAALDDERQQLVRDQVAVLWAAGAEEQRDALARARADAMGGGVPSDNNGSLGVGSPLSPPRQGVWDVGSSPRAVPLSPPALAERGRWGAHSASTSSSGGSSSAGDVDGGGDGDDRCGRRCGGVGGVVLAGAVAGACAAAYVEAQREAALEVGDMWLTPPGRDEVFQRHLQWLGLPGRGGECGGPAATSASTLRDTRHVLYIPPTTGARRGVHQRVAGGPRSVGVGGVIDLEPTDALIAVGMQEDFFVQLEGARHAGGACPVFEAEQVVDTIAELLLVFAGRGAQVYPVREYRPDKHLAFLGRSPDGRQAVHAVQGSSGARFHPRIGEAITYIMHASKGMPSRGARRASPSVLRADRMLCVGDHDENDFDMPLWHEGAGTHTHTHTHHPWGQAATVSWPRVAYHNYHADVFSMGVLGETEAVGGRAWVRAGAGVCGSVEDVATLASAAFLPQAQDSPMWDEDFEANAAPMVAADRHAGVPATITTLRDHLRDGGVERVFICGIPLDTTVVRTAVAATRIAARVFIIIDACRPLYVATHGPHDGFVSSPAADVLEPLFSGISGRRVSFVSAASFFPCSRRAVLRRHLAAKYPPPAAPAVPRASLAFPHALSSLGLYNARLVSRRLRVEVCPTRVATGVYDLNRVPALNALQRFGVHMTGLLSAAWPLHYLPAERAWLQIPQRAQVMCFAYPLEGSDRLATHADPYEGHSGDSGRLFTHTLVNPDVSFACVGGFVYLDGSRVVGAAALCTAGEGLTFRPPVSLSRGLRERMHAQDRFRPLTIPSMRSAGARWFGWVNPGEEEGFDTGGMAYVMHNDPAHPAATGVWFPMVDLVLARAAQHER